MLNRSEHPPCQAGMNYILPRDEGELERLNALHKLAIATVYKGRIVYDKDVALSPGSRVLDVGSGTGIWLTDLSKEVSSGVELHGADVSADNFPTSHPSNVHFHITSATDLFEEWSGQFDFVHQRHLMGALLADEWPKAISEIYRVLKPGGHVQVMELHLTDVFNAGPAYSHLAKLFEDMLHKRGLLPDCAKQLGRMLNEAGFVDIITLEKHVPAGISEGEIGALGEFAILAGLRRLIPLFLSEGLASSEVEILQLFENVEGEWTAQHDLISASLVYATKPL